MAVQPIARRRNAPGLSDGSVDHLRAGTRTPTAMSATGTTRQTAAAGHEARTPVRSPIGSNDTSLVAGNAGRGATCRAHRAAPCVRPVVVPFMAVAELR